MVSSLFIQSNLLKQLHNYNLYSIVGVTGEQREKRVYPSALMSF
jgi:hypothetical protein